jgi:hypothetical protein
MSLTCFLRLIMTRNLTRVMVVTVVILLALPGSALFLLHTARSASGQNASLQLTLQSSVCPNGGQFSPLGWTIASPSPSNASIDSNKVLREKLINVGGSFNGPYYAVAHQGTFPFFKTNHMPYNPPIQGSNVSLYVAYQNSSLLSNHHFNIFLGLYYLFSTNITAGGQTHDWLEAQFRFGTDSTTNTFSPGDAFGWAEVVPNPIGVGQNYTLTNADIWAHYQRALAAWGIPANTPAKLMGIEPGLEGYGVNYVNIAYCYTLVSNPALSESGGGGGGRRLEA